MSVTGLLSLDRSSLLTKFISNVRKISTEKKIRFISNLSKVDKESNLIIISSIGFVSLKELQLVVDKMKSYDNKIYGFVNINKYSI